jgi:hypothetical protein
MGAINRDTFRDPPPEYKLTWKLYQFGASPAAIFHHRLEAWALLRKDYVTPEDVKSDRP